MAVRNLSRSRDEKQKPEPTSVRIRFYIAASRAHADKAPARKIMKIANIAGRAMIITPGGLIDLNKQSQGRFASSVDDLISELGAVKEWLECERPEPIDRRTADDLERDLSALHAPVTRPPSDIRYRS